MATLRCLGLLTLTNLRASLSLRGAFLLQASFMFLNNLIYFAVWVIFFRRVHSLGGFGMPEMQLGYGVVAAGFGLAVALAGGLRDLSKLIVDGGLDAYLVQPKPLLMQAICSRTLASGWGDLASGLLMAAGSRKVSLAHAPLLLLAVTLSASVLIATAVLFHSAAFWLGPVDSLARSLWECMITFSIYPETIFNGQLRLLIYTLIPAAFAGFIPARLAREPSLANAACAIGGAAVIVAAALATFERGLRRYESGNTVGAR